MEQQEKYIFIVNPKAGKGESMNFITKIKAAAKAYNLDYEIYITTSGGDAREYVRERCKTLPCPTRFFACGGDGTMNEVINGMVGCDFATLGILPLGSGNDYIKAFGERNFLDLDAQINGEAVYIDLILVCDRYVANMCNIGFDATVAHNFVKFKSMPAVSGKMAYTMGVFYTLCQKIGQPMTIVLDNGTEICDDMLLCSISKGIYCGGQFRTAPRADPTDGFMDVCPIKKISRAKFLKFFSLYKNGTHFDVPEMKDIVSYYKCKKATVKGVHKLPVCFDGDTAFLDGTVTFELKEKAIKLILPAQAVKNDEEEKLRSEAFPQINTI